MVGERARSDIAVAGTARLAHFYDTPRSDKSIAETVAPENLS
ncbi:hypothetical protein [Nocardia uniformis]|nr:hypothetical protein [Nocardia uniformis]